MKWLFEVSVSWVWLHFSTKRRRTTAGPVKWSWRGSDFSRGEDRCACNVGDNLKYIIPRYRLICFSPPSWPIQSNIRTTWPEDDVSSRHIFHFLSSPLEFSPPARSSSHTLIVLTKPLKGDPSDQELEGLRSVLLPPQPQHLPPWLRRRLRLLRQDVQVGPRLQRLILGAPEKLWEGQRNSETQVSIHDAFYIFSWLKNSFINTFVEKWRLKGRFYYHLKLNFQIWGNETRPKIRNTSSLWLPRGQTDRQKGVKHWGFYLNQFNVFQKVDGLLKHLAFDNMKRNPAVNPFASDIKPTGMRGHFVREGKVTHTHPYLITRCVQI